jgi:hypothetical protein
VAIGRLALAAAPRRLDRLALGLGLLVGVLLLASIQTVENPSGDSARYLGLADALRSEGRYAFDGQAHTRFPPGFPLLLAGVREAFGAGYAASLRAVALQAVLALWAGYALLRATGHPGLGLVSMVLLASSPYVFERATRAVAPESAYVAASFVALLLALRLARGAGPRRAAASAGLALATAAALALRSVGVALLVPLAAGVALPWLRRRERAGLAAFGPALLAGAGLQLAWLRWQRRHEVEIWPGEFMSSYAAQVVLRDPHEPGLGRATALDLLQRALDNATGHAAAFSELTLHLPFVDPLAYSPLVVLPLALSAAGLWRRLTSTPLPLLELYALAYLGILLLWPFDEGPRFLLAVYPLALLYAAEGARGLAARAAAAPRRARLAAGGASAALLAAALVDLAGSEAPPGRQALASLAVWGLLGAAAPLPLERLARGLPAARLARGAAALGLLASVLLGTAQIAPLARENRRGGPAALRHPETVDAAAWIRAATAPEDAVMAGQEAVVHYLTGRRGIPFPVTSDPEVLRRVLREQRVRYWMVLEDEPHPYFRPTERARFEAFEAAHPGLTRAVHRGRNYRIVAVVPEPPNAERR